MKLSQTQRSLPALLLLWAAGQACAQVEIKPTAHAGDAAPVPTALEAMQVEPLPAASQIDLGETPRGAQKPKPAALLATTPAR